MIRKVNECIIPPEGDLEFLLTLDGLAEGKLDYIIVRKDKYRKPLKSKLEGSIIGYGLPLNLFIFDNILQFDRFILPFSKNYYEGLEDSIVNRMLDSSTIKELFKDRVLSFTNEKIFKDEKSKEKCLDLINKGYSKLKYDYLGTYSILTYPSSGEIEWLKHLNFLNSKDDFYTSNEWISHIDINKLLIENSRNKIEKKIHFPIETYPLKFETESSVYFDTFTMGSSLIADKVINLSSICAFNYLLREFSDLKSDLIKELEQKNLFQVELKYDTPFGISLILNELPNNTHPSEMYDMLLEHRKDKIFFEFKKWLYSFEEARRTNNIAKLLKSKKEIESVTNALKNEYRSSTINNSITVSPSYLGSIFEDTLSYFSGKLGIKTMKNIISEIEKSFLNRKPEHLQYIKYIGDHIIKSRSLENELKRCFSKK